MSKTLLTILIVFSAHGFADPEYGDAGSDTTIVVHAHRLETTGNRTHLDQEQIQALPEGDQADLSKVVGETVPGTIEGPGGQLFFRGTYEASVQYQLDGIQLPDLATARFGQIFPVQAVDRIDVITGGLPAEYGERLGGVVNILTRSGALQPSGEFELKYGSNSTFSPSVSYGGAAADGKLHYFAAATFSTTSRALDTPQPVNSAEINVGGEQTIHDNGQDNSEILKLDWMGNESDRFTLLLLNARRFMQLPNFPSSFSRSDSVFSTGDSYGNPPYRYTPPYTNDTQTESDSYVQTSWKHTFSDRTFLQLSPYWKSSTIVVANDLANDLAGVENGQSYSSFSENRRVDTLGAHADLTQRIGEKHRLKAGLFAESGQTGGVLNVVTATNTPGNTQTYLDSAHVHQTQEALYVEGDFVVADGLTVNPGVRANWTQLALSDGEHPGDSSLQPRLGVSYAAATSTTVHLYYGRLYHNAPPEDLRVAFNGGGTNLVPYDVKSENADYYEAGVVHEWAEEQTASLTAYYRHASNWLDDAQVPNTYVTQPINFAVGYAEGVDLSLRGRLRGKCSYFANYSFMEAKVKGLSGGIFTQETPTNSLQNLDTAQAHTAQLGLLWKPDRYSWSVNALYGSGLPTSQDLSKFLPAHLTFDTSFGYEFPWRDWKFRTALDVTNIFDQPYPITIADGLVGSQYAAGRQFFVRVGAAF